MRYWVGITDKDWFDYLSHRLPDEVNFWQPSGRYKFKAIQPNDLFLFKLKSPNNFIVGGGIFLSNSILPLSLAWDAFGDKNGAPDFNTFSNKIRSYHHDEQLSDQLIGCNILAQPFFLPRDKWIPIPKNWGSSIVVGKTYDTSEPYGKQLWEDVQAVLHSLPQHNLVQEIGKESSRYGKEFLTSTRLGQGTFRILVTETYNRKCAITGERTLPVLESAHIKPFSKGGDHRIDNGLLLRSDFHKLFDLGYMTITPDYHIEISKRIKEKFHNGREYYKFHGNELTLPLDPKSHPSKDFIDWHNQKIYVP